MIIQVIYYIIFYYFNYFTSIIDLIHYLIIIKLHFIGLYFLFLDDKFDSFFIFF